MDVDSGPQHTSLFDRVAASMADFEGGELLPPSGGTSRFVAPGTTRHTFQFGAPGPLGFQPDVDDEILLHQMSHLGETAVLDERAQEELIMDRWRTALGIPTEPGLNAATTITDVASVGGSSALATCTEYISACSLCISQEGKAVALRADRDRALQKGSARGMQAPTVPMPSSNVAQSGPQLPLVGTATSSLALNGFALDPTVSSLRQERQLWRLSGLIMGGYIPAQWLSSAQAPGARLREAACGADAGEVSGQHMEAFVPCGSLPLDACAHDARLSSSLAALDPGIVLAATLLDWLQMAAADDAPEGLLDGASRVQVLGPDGEQGSANPDVGSVVEDVSGFVTFDAAPGTGVGGIGTGGSPDLDTSLWQLLRCGMPRVASLLACDAGQFVRASLLTVGSSPWSTHEEEEDGGEEGGMDTERASGRAWVQAGNPFLPLTRRSCASAASLSPSPCSPYARALLLHGAREEGVLELLKGSSLSQEGEAALGTWEDCLWATLHAAVSSRCIASSSILRCGQAGNDPHCPYLPHAGVCVEGLEAEVSKGDAVWQGGKGREVIPLSTPADALHLLARFGAGLSSCSASPYAQLVHGLVELATSSAPWPRPLEDGEGALSRAYESLSPALQSFLCSLPRLVLPLLDQTDKVGLRAGKPASAEAAMHYAVQFNRAGAVAPSLLGPVSPDAIPTTAMPLPPHAVPLLRWAAHTLLMMRTHSPVAGHPTLRALQPMTAESSSSAVAVAYDDVLYAYARHLSSCVSSTRHCVSLLLVCRQMTRRDRAVRALVAYTLSLPYAGPLQDAEAAGGAAGILDAGATPAAPRAVLFAAARRVIGQVGQYGDPLPSALRLAVLTHITLDTATVMDCAAGALAAGVSHSSSREGHGGKGGGEEGLAVLGIQGLGHVGGLPLAAQAAGITTLDFLRVAGLQLLTGGSTTGLLPASLDNFAVWAANALSRLLFTEALAAESKEEAHPETLARAAARAVSRSAFACLRLLHFGLGRAAAAAPDVGSAPLAEPFLPHFIIEGVAEGEQDEGAGAGPVADGLAELCSWRAIVACEGAWGEWREAVRKPLPAPPPALAGDASKAGGASASALLGSVFGAIGFGLPGNSLGPVPAPAHQGWGEAEVQGQVLARARALHEDVVRGRWTALRSCTAGVCSSLLRVLAPPSSPRQTSDHIGSGPDPRSNGCIPGDLGAEMLIRDDPRVTAVSAEVHVGADGADEVGSLGAIPETGVVRGLAVSRALRRLQEVVAATAAWVEEDAVAGVILRKELRVVLAQARAALGQVSDDTLDGPLPRTAARAARDAVTQTRAI